MKSGSESQRLLLIYVISKVMDTVKYLNNNENLASVAAVTPQNDSISKCETGVGHTYLKVHHPCLMKKGEKALV